MKIQRADLIDAVRKCLAGIDKTSGVIEGADALVFSGGAVHSYNASISVSVPVPSMEGLTGAVKAQEFYKFLTKLTDEEIDIRPSTDKWWIDSGRTKAEMVLMSSAVSQYIDQLDLATLEWNALPDDFFDALTLCRLPANDTTLRGVLVRGDVMLATDSVRVSTYRFAGAELGTFWIDEPSVAELLKLGGAKELALSEVWTHWRGEDGVVFSCRKKNPTGFPADAVLGLLETHAHKPKYVSGRLPEGLSDAIERVSIFGQQVQKATLIRVQITAEAVELSAARYSGRVEESVPLEVPFAKDPEVVVFVDSAFLAEAVKKAPNFYISPVNDTQTLVFSSDVFTQLISTHNR